jgi:hypothetical protein
MTIDQGYIYFINTQFLKALCGLNGFIYFIFAICMFNYGIRLFWILQNLQEQREKDEKELELIKILNKRVRLL